MQICQNIKQARVSSGLTQDEIADKLGTKRSTYKNWEDATEPSLSIIKAIAGHLGVPAYKLLIGVIDFEEPEARRPDVNINAIISANDYDRLKFSLSVLGSIFSPDPNLGKDIRPGTTAVPLVDKRKLPGKGEKKGVQRGT